MSQESQTRDPLLQVPPEIMLRTFDVLKNPPTPVGFKPANLVSRGI